MSYYCNKCGRECDDDEGFWGKCDDCLEDDL